ncbi:copper homeostasis protein CutC [Alkalibacterium psychrotolerans]
MIKEFCAENFSSVPEAVQAGINRIELCDRLDLGGTTPSPEVQLQTNLFAHKHDVTVVCMIRSRGGDFIYTDEDKAVMLKQVEEAIVNGADGLVFGALTPKNKVDWPFVEALLERSGEKETVFHMAFDQLPQSDQLEAIHGLIDRKVTRLLTRGAHTGLALKNSEWINQLIERADGKLEILAGGGLTFENLDEAAASIHTDQFHGTQIVSL